MQIDTINKEQSGDTYQISSLKLKCRNIVFSYPDEMPHTIWGFTVCQSICILVSQNSKV